MIWVGDHRKLLTRMKQIVITADPDTHEWLKKLARSERRTMGQQALHLLLGRKQAEIVTPKKKEAK